MASKKLMDLLNMAIAREIQVSIQYMWQHVLATGIKGVAVEDIFKKTAISETMNVEFRAEFLNAFNHQNFYFGRSAASGNGGVRGFLGAGATNGEPASINSGTFGRIFNAYQDTSTTNDPGGRLIQFVICFNF